VASRTTPETVVCNCTWVVSPVCGLGKAPLANDTAGTTMQPVSNRLVSRLRVLLHRNACCTCLAIVVKILVSNGPAGSNPGGRGFIIPYKTPCYPVLRVRGKNENKGGEF